MKKILFVLSALLLAGPFSFAQDVRRVMTMEEAVLGRGLTTPSPVMVWTGDKSVVALEDAPSGFPRRPQSSPLAYTRDNNLYDTDAAGVDHAITAYRDPGIVCGTSVSRTQSAGSSARRSSSAASASGSAVLAQHSLSSSSSAIV